MWDRRVVYAAGYRAAMVEARHDLQKLAADLQAEGNRLRAELAEICRAHDELRAAVLARSNVELELAELRRLQAIARARTAVRDPAAPLN
jgi:hypothetical protein